MTNAEIIQAIKAEIERRRLHFNKEAEKYQALNNGYSQNCYGARDALRDLENFLDTLESEKPINSDDAMKELDEKIALVKQRGTWDGVDVDKYMDEVRGREPEKPMQEGLEEAVVDYFEGYWPGIETAEQCNADLHFTPPAIMRLARHFAQWGAEHLKK